MTVTKVITALTILVALFIPSFVLACDEPEEVVTFQAVRVREYEVVRQPAVFVREVEVVKQPRESRFARFRSKTVNKERAFGRRAANVEVRVGSGVQKSSSCSDGNCAY